MRGAQFVRQWRVLIALRRQRWTLEQLARELQCSQRTIARDIEVLEAVGLPITTTVERRRGLTVEFLFAGNWPAWPRNEVAPVADLKSTGAL
jgi:predicted DNA-binding transcriptional regulator YafY